MYTDVLLQENQLLSGGLLFNWVHYHWTILALFVQWWLRSSFTSCRTTMNWDRHWLELRQQFNFHTELNAQGFDNLWVAIVPSLKLHRNFSQNFKPVGWWMFKICFADDVKPISTKEFLKDSNYLALQLFRLNLFHWHIKEKLNTNSYAWALQLCLLLSTQLSLLYVYIMRRLIFWGIKFEHIHFIYFFIKPDNFILNKARLSLPNQHQNFSFPGLKIP